MPKFTLKLNTFARGNITVYNLLIDNVDQFDAFEEDLEEIYTSQFRSLAAIISQISENRKPPSKGKRRKIEGIEKAAELKTKDLRLYYIVFKEYGYTICLGGMKKNQKKDINKLKSLKTQIEKQIKENGIEIREE